MTKQGVIQKNENMCLNFTKVSNFDKVYKEVLNFVG